MKSLIISSVMFLLCTAFMIYNSISLQYLTDEMLDRIDSMPRDVNLSLTDSQEMAIRELDELTLIWNEHRDSVSFTVTFDYIAAVTFALNSTREFCQANIGGEYLAGLETLRESVLRLHELESFSWHNIL